MTFASLPKPTRYKHRYSWAKMVKNFLVFLLAPGNISAEAPERLQHKQDPQLQRWICSRWDRNALVPDSSLRVWSGLGYVDHISESGGATVLFPVFSSFQYY